MARTLSDRIRHFFHVVSNVRPIVWLCLYIILTPIFALIYSWLPDGQFRIPDGAGTDYGSWLYYSIVTITTLGFGDYTPAHALAQCVTAVEVMCGLIILGLFLNAVGAMKSEIDVESELEKQRRVHAAQEKEKLLKSAPSILHNLNTFLAYCRAVTTPAAHRGDEAGSYNPDFTFNDMADLYKPSDLAIDNSHQPAVERMMKCASRTSLYLDSLQGRIDMTLWPELMEDCFAFVADYQLFASADLFDSHRHAADEAAGDSAAEKEASAKIAAWKGDFKGADKSMAPYTELYHFIKSTGALALKIEAALSRIASEKEEAE